MIKKRIVKAHDDIIRLNVIRHYEDHQERTESNEFVKTKRQLHEEGHECYIGNGFCEGGLEVHHNLVEYSADSEIDWDRFKEDHPEVTSVDDIDQMLVLCEKHHRHEYFGIHNIDYPTWELQRYMTHESLLRFEKKVKEIKANGNES